LQSLTSIYKLGKDDLATYQRLDFGMNTMKGTFEQAFNNELQYKNNPDKYKLLKVDDKAVTAKVNDLDFPGVTPFERGLEFENAQYANIIIKNVLIYVCVVLPLVNQNYLKNRHYSFSFRLSSYEYQLTDSLPYDS